MYAAFHIQAHHAPTKTNNRLPFWAIKACVETEITQLNIPGVYRYMICEQYLLKIIPLRGRPRGGTQLFFFGGCVPRVDKNVGSRERIFLEKWGLGDEDLEKFGSREVEFRPKYGWKSKDVLKIENGGHKSGALTVNW